MPQKIFIASDHAGFELKTFLKKELIKQYEVIDLGANSIESVDYPDYANLLAEKITDADKGVLICGSGVGISIAANRHKNVRAALCHNIEIAKLSRQHNDANVVALGARFLKNDEALEIVKAFLTNDFEGGRHANRVKKLSC